jgi:hypothetical protein
VNTPSGRNAHLTAVGGLGAALAFLATEAAAAVHYVDNPDATQSSPCGAYVSASFNPVTGSATANFNSPTEAIGMLSYGCATALSFGSTPGTITSVGFLSTPVTANTVINGSTGAWTDGTTFGTNVTYINGVINHSLIAYRFKTTEDAGTYLYGWAEFSQNSFSPNSVTLYSFAYEDTGAGIVAGATSSIPEPGVTAVFFGLAAIVLVGFRRMRRNIVGA